MGRRLAPPPPPGARGGGGARARERALRARQLGARHRHRRDDLGGSRMAADLDRVQGGVPAARRYAVDRGRRADAGSRGSGEPGSRRRARSRACPGRVGDPPRCAAVLRAQRTPLPHAGRARRPLVEARRGTAVSRNARRGAGSGGLREAAGAGVRRIRAGSEPRPSRAGARCDRGCGGCGARGTVLRGLLAGAARGRYGPGAGDAALRRRQAEARLPRAAAGGTGHRAHARAGPRAWTRRRQRCPGAGDRRSGP